nr:TPA: Per os infectivity factor 1 [Oryctes rhinoceros nudivirus]
MIDLTNTIFGIVSILIVICIIIAIVLTSNNKIHELTFEQKAIPKFSIDLQFDPYPQVVNIENQYDCNVHSLRVCDINDSTTLFGCKELIVRCHHFDEDTPFIENNETLTIPKNQTADEGYALAITTISDACNPYHGDMTLVTANSDASEYMLICTCKNPGYIGNESLLGNCTSVFICNGKVDDVNKPLNEINCVCESRQKTIRYDDGLPVCKDLLVHEANELYDDWSNIVPWSSFRQLETSNFNPTISGNLKTSRLLDPCRSSIHDTSIEILNASYDSVRKQCSLTDNGFPVVNGLLRFSSTEKAYVGASAVLATGGYEFIRFSDNLAGQRHIIGIVSRGLKFSDKYKNTTTVVHPTNGLSLGHSTALSVKSKTKFVGPACYGSWPTYSCSSIEERDSYITSGLALPRGRVCPGAFLWSRSDWDDHEFLVVRSATQNIQDGYSLSTTKLTSLDDIDPYGIQWSTQTSSEYTGLLRFLNSADYSIHKQTITG